VEQDIRPSVALAPLALRAEETTNAAVSLRRPVTDGSRKAGDAGDIEPETLPGTGFEPGAEPAESSFRDVAGTPGRPKAVDFSHLPDRDIEPGPPPPLDSLVQRIPSETRETLEELFRAKFVGVRRFPAKSFKAQS
jgi:hypothetical protein